MEISRSERDKETYLRNKERIKERSKISNSRIREKIRNYIVEYLKLNPCCKCGESDIVVLEFHHIKDKKYNITELIRNTSYQKLLLEIPKCQVLCANCHRRETAKEQGWYKNL